jgi:hypothetical protein
MNQLKTIFADRRNALQRAKWLQPALKGMDLLLWAAGLFIHDFVVSLVLVLLGMGINHLLTPVVVERIRSFIFPSFDVRMGSTVTLSIRINRHSSAPETAEN